MIDLTTLLEGGAVLPLINAPSRKLALTRISETLADSTGLDARDIFEAVMDRERLGSTGVGEGVAIPHARIDGVEAPVGAYARLETGVDFEAVDDRPCDLIFMLLAPQSAGADHLRALAQVSRAFRQPAIRDRLRKAGTLEEVRSILCQPDEAAQAAHGS